MTNIVDRVIFIDTILEWQSNEKRQFKDHVCVSVYAVMIAKVRLLGDEKKEREKLGTTDLKSFWKKIRFKEAIFFNNTIIIYWTYNVISNIFLVSGALRVYYDTYNP